MLLLSIYVYADTARVSVCQEPTVSPTSQATLTAATVSQSDARRWECWPIISHKSVSLMVEWPIRFQRGKTHLSTPPVMSLAWAALFVCTAGGAVHTSSTDTWPRTRNQRQSFLSAKGKKKSAQVRRSWGNLLSYILMTCSFSSWLPPNVVWF